MKNILNQRKRLNHKKLKDYYNAKIKSNIYL